MAARKASCLTPVLAAKVHCRFCTYSIELFTRAFAGMLDEYMVALIQSRSLEVNYNKLFKLVNSTKV